MAAKFYAVLKGLTPGIYRSWDECKAQVDGFSGAKYKSFKTLEEAKAYLGDIDFSIANDAVSPNYLTLPETEAVAYVDGSYRDDVKEFSLGVVLFHKGEEIHLSEKFNNEELVSMRNVAGEIKASEAAMEYARNHNIKKLSIYHDYEGIAKWCTGEWKANKEGTIAYRLKYHEISSYVDITFVKVAGHTGDTYNELADKLAKEALGII